MVVIVVARGNPRSYMCVFVCVGGEVQLLNRHTIIYILSSTKIIFVCIYYVCAIAWKNSAQNSFLRIIYPLTILIVQVRKPSPRP